MAVYADFTFYSEQFLGIAIAESDFARLAMLASKWIDELTLGRAAPIVADETAEATITAIGMATCAVAEELHALESAGGAVQSERVGNYSVTYANPPSQSRQLASVARRFLWETDLMYRGLNEDER